MVKRRIDGYGREQALIFYPGAKVEVNWNMKNFVADQIELIKNQVGEDITTKYFTYGVAIL